MSAVYLQTSVHGGCRHRDGRSVASAADRDISSGPGTQEVNPDQSDIHDVNAAPAECKGAIIHAPCLCHTLISFKKNEVAQTLSDAFSGFCLLPGNSFIYLMRRSDS